MSIDHRKGTPFARGDVIAYTRAAWRQVPDISYRIETVHQLSDLGAVVTHTVRGTSRDGFEAEWREINLMTFDGDLVSRCELFDEDELDAALARFDQLGRPMPRWTTRPVKRFSAWRRTSRPATGTAWPDSGGELVPSTIAGGW